MMRRVRLFVLLGVACSIWPALAAETAPSTASRWESLWRNADQRGAQLLRKGDAPGAAKVFADPRRKAYAELLAGDYAGAAKSLRAFDDGEAHYNRGNALAHAGQLTEALKAYDAALKHDPRNADASHNRDLVAKALQQQQTPPPGKQNAGDNTPNDGKSQAQSGNGQDKQSGQHDPNGQQAQPSANEAKAANDAKDQGGQSPPKPPDGKPLTGQDAKSAATQPQSQDRNAAGGTSDKPDSGAKGQPAGTLPDTSTATAKNQGSEPDSAEQARRDAEASLAAKAPHSTEAASSGDAGQTGGAVTGAIPKTPPTEKQLAQAQWLRSIPDDPGGLLRRKFMIEHYMRQRNESP